MLQYTMLIAHTPTHNKIFIMREIPCVVPLKFMCPRRALEFTTCQVLVIHSLENFLAMIFLVWQNRHSFNQQKANMYGETIMYMLSVFSYKNWMLNSEHLVISCVSYNMMKIVQYKKSTFGTSQSIADSIFLAKWLNSIKLKAHKNPHLRVKSMNF